MARISAVIITLNEERHIARCLQSLAGVADEVLVIDSTSTDRTVEIAKAHGASVIDLPWEGYADTKNRANAMTAHDYVLSIDADEELSPELKASILAIKERLTGAYKVNRLNNYYGHWLKHGGAYPDSKIRLFNKHQAHWVGDVHEKLELKGSIPVSALNGDLMHYTCDSVRDHIERINKYSSLAAQEMFDKGKSFSFLKMTIGANLRFNKILFLKLGFLDGIAGVSYAVMSAYSVFLRQAKLWELHKNHRRA